jgi:hypothetical protein
MPALVSIRACLDSSEEPEGGSPTSERSVSLQLSGTHACRVQRPKKNVFGWVVRQLQRKQQQQQCQACMAAPSLVSGSSYDSLCSLEEQCSTSCSTEPAASQSHPFSAEQFPGLTHPQQHQPQQQLYPVLEHAAEPPSASSSSSRSGAPLGFLGRAVRAVLRPVVRAVVGAAQALASSAGPQGPGNNDNSMAERVINVLTSLPFIAVGLHGLRWVAATGLRQQLPRIWSWCWLCSMHVVFGHSGCAADSP